MKALKIIFISLLVILPIFLMADTGTDYKLLAPIPLDDSGVATQTIDPAGYIEGIVQLAIAIAAALAVIRIIFGGIQYVTTDIPGVKGEAKKTIQGALGGLLLAMSAYLILVTVNPDLVNLNLSIERLKQGSPLGTSLGAEGGIVDVGASCQNCDTVSSYVPQKTPMPCKTPGPCKLNKELLSRLKNMNQILSSVKIQMVVTDSYPASIDTHKEACSYDGTCADINFADKSLAKNYKNVESVIVAADANGIKAEYEVADAEMVKNILSATKLDSTSIKYVPWITAPHFSAYMKELR